MLPVARRTPPLDWTGVPPAIRSKFEGRVSALARTEREAADLVAHYGDAAFCPYLPVLLIVPGAPTVQVLEGRGVTDAAELRDLAVVTWHRTTERLRENHGAMFDFDALREKHGLMRREQVDAAIREALQERVKLHKQNPVTDPGRDPLRDTYPRQTWSRYSRGNA